MAKKTTKTVDVCDRESTVMPLLDCESCSHCFTFNNDCSMWCRLKHCEVWDMCKDFEEVV